MRWRIFSRCKRNETLEKSSATSWTWTLYTIKAESSEKIFSQIKTFVEEHYLEAEKIPIKDEYQEAYGDFE